MDKDFEMISGEKQRLREKMRALLAGHTSDFAQKALALAQSLRAHQLWREAAGIAAFVAKAGEVSVLNPWPHDKRIFLPRVQDADLVFCEVASADDLEAGSFGIFEPRDSCLVRENTWDLVLVPGLAFDATGARLGRGKGYYDRFLSEQSRVLIGVCFQEQVVAKVPVHASDVSVQFLATPDGIFPCVPRSNL